MKIHCTLPLSLLILFGSFIQAEQKKEPATNSKNAQATNSAEEAPEPTEQERKQMAALKTHFPDGLVDKDGNAVELDALKGKMIGIYFSASWCAPCRVFTPQLISHRNRYKSDFEVVFVSSDRSDEAMKKYMEKMPWPAVKFDSKSRGILGKKYGVRGIPSLILLNADGSLNTRNGRGVIVSKTDMKKYKAEGKTAAAPPSNTAPKVPKLPALSLDRHFSDGIVDREGKPVNLAELKGKIVGLYFSASWCGPCKRFTPILKKYYEKYPDDFEVVFVSGDRSADSMAKYIKDADMPWASIPFGKSSIKALNQRYQINGIPSLVLINDQGELISKDGRQLVHASKPLDMTALAKGEVEVYLCGRCRVPHVRTIRK